MCTLCTNAESVANVDTKARSADNTTLHPPQHEAAHHNHVACLGTSQVIIGLLDICPVFCCHLTQSVFCLNEPIGCILDFYQKVHSTTASCSSYALHPAGVNVPSHKMKQCLKRFLVHNELGTCRACIVRPDQPVLCMPVQMVIS